MIAAQIMKDAEGRMEKALDVLRNGLKGLRTGRASPAMLDGVRVEVYGSQMPLNQVANVSASSHDMILVQPWDRSTLKAIERGINEANIGLNPTNDGQVGSNALHTLLPVAGALTSVTMIVVLRNNNPLFLVVGAVLLIVALVGGVGLAVTQRGAAARTRRGRGRRVCRSA